MNRVKIRELALIAVAGGLIVFEVLGFRNAWPAASAATTAVAKGAGYAATRAAVGVAKGTASWLGTTQPARRSDIPMVVASRERRRPARPRLRVVTASFVWCPAGVAKASRLAPRDVRDAYTVVLKQGAL